MYLKSLRGGRDHTSPLLGSAKHHIANCSAFHIHPVVMLSPQGFAQASTERLAALHANHQEMPDLKVPTVPAMTLAEKRESKAYTGHCRAVLTAEGKQKALENSLSDKKSGVIGYSGYRAGREEHIGSTMFAWAEPEAHERAIQGPSKGHHRFFDASDRTLEGGTWSHSKRVLHQKRQIDVEEVPTPQMLETQYRNAMTSVGGDAGVQRLVRSMAVAVSHHCRSITEGTFHVKRAFMNADVDGSGKISRAELRRFCELISCVFTEHQVVALMGHFDHDLKGQIDTANLQATLVNTMTNGSGAGYLHSESSPRVTSVYALRKEVARRNPFYGEDGQDGATLVTAGDTNLAAGASATATAVKADEAALPRQHRRHVAPGESGEAELRLQTGDVLVRAARGTVGADLPPGGWVVPGTTCGPTGTVAGSNRHGQAILTLGHIVSVDLVSDHVLHEVVGGPCYALRAHALVASKALLARMQRMPLKVGATTVPIVRAKV